MHTHARTHTHTDTHTHTCTHTHGQMAEQTAVISIILCTGHHCVEFCVPPWGERLIGIFEILSDRVLCPPCVYARIRTYVKDHDTAHRKKQKNGVAPYYGCSLSPGKAA